MMPMLAINPCKCDMVNSDKCDNDCLWVEFDGEANPGDRWHKNKVVPQKNEVDEEAQKRKPFIEFRYTVTVTYQKKGNNLRSYFT
jgi:hypothetical protein